MVFATIQHQYISAYVHTTMALYMSLMDNFANDEKLILKKHIQNNTFFKKKTDSNVTQTCIHQSRSSS